MPVDRRTDSMKGSDGDYSGKRKLEKGKERGREKA
jgi:hypothetical protein